MMTAPMPAIRTLLPAAKSEFRDAAGQHAGAISTFKINHFESIIPNLCAHSFGAAFIRPLEHRYALLRKRNCAEKAGLRDRL